MFSLTLSLFLTLSLSLCLSLPLSASLCLSLPLSASLCLSLPLSASLCLSLPLSASLCLPVFLSVCSCVCPSVRPSLLLGVILKVFSVQAEERRRSDSKAGSVLKKLGGELPTIGDEKITYLIFTPDELLCVSRCVLCAQKKNFS